MEIILEKLLNDILNECRHYTSEGRVATYIPELAKADTSEFAICIAENDGNIVSVGDYTREFTAQSIIKPLILLLALMDNGEEAVRRLVGVEATGKPFDAFNYSDRALTCENINPMINTGAIALWSIIKGETYAERFERLLDLAKRIAGSSSLYMDEQVYRSEKATGNKNRALVYMLKAYGLIHDDAEDLLDCYFRACSIKVTVGDLARIGRVFANGGADPVTGERIFDKSYCHYVNAIMVTCGMYDGSGEFAINVGVPAKSGVGGGIMAVVPGRMGIGLYSPALDFKGNSIAGIKALERLSRELELSIF